jgi:alkylation response protein AidB-like acyl-CoA dehydrogenase
MDFSWSEEQHKFRQTVVDFARRELNDGVRERDAAAHFPRDLWRKCAEFGILALPLPEAYGGSGSDALTTTLAMEALGYGCSDQGFLFSIHAHMWAVEIPILHFGTDAQKERYLPRLADGTWVAAHGISEPNSGSDAFAMATTAERRGDRYVLNGAKTFVTNAPVADLFLAFATVDKKKGMWGVTGFLIERDTPGLTIGKPIEKMGLTTSPMGEMIFEDCVVPAENVLGRVGQGSAIFNHSMGWERSCILASTVGAMERQLETSIKYAQDRRQFGKPIGNFQLVASRIVDMKVRLETCRLLLYRAAWTQAEGGMSPLDAAMAKLYISECAVASALDAIQVHGGYGYMKEFELERELRDMIGGRLYSGTSEIQRLVVARNLGLATSS